MEDKKGNLILLRGTCEDCFYMDKECVYEAVNERHIRGYLSNLLRDLSTRILKPKT